MLSAPTIAEPARGEPVEPAASCRGAWQRPRREQERNRRRQAAEAALRLRAAGATHGRAAACLGIPASTLRSWKPLRREPDRPAAWRGRPCKNAPPERRGEVLLELRKWGPHAGVPWLKQTFPDVARGELVELKATDRKRRRAGRARFAARLRWQQAGAVWAIDYAEPPAPVDGRHKAVVSVRDLASGLQLAWLPVAAATADETIAVLEDLFREHGPPLVLKADNGSPFIAERTRALLTRWNVLPLYSPRYTPNYNGSCEAGIGGLKSRTRHLADYDGGEHAWTSAHLEAARRMANEEHYPRRLKGRTAAEVWRAREPISEQERRRFRDAVDRLRRSHAATWTTTIEARDRACRASLDRKAVPEALVELGVLSILRSVVTPTIKPL
jgi:hypothetical protein